MPVNPTYPGVYIQKLTSPVHPITGVATSIAAFIGWAAQGPVSEAVLVQSWMDFARQFGGLDSRSYLGYAVNQFFGNGGQQAYIIRLVWTDAATASTTVGGLKLWANSPGIWANNYNRQYFQFDGSESERQYTGNVFEPHGRLCDHGHRQ